MPSLQTPSGATIHYAVHGTGSSNVLLLAPGGMRSSMDKWNGHPYDPYCSLDRTQFRLIGMDQRNSNSLSEGPLGTGWESYRDDQLALLDHLDVMDGCLLVGSCIGPSFALSLLKHSPDRFSGAVLLQPIGLACHTTEPGDPWVGLNSGKRRSFVDWSDEFIHRKRFDKSDLETLHERMYGDKKDFVFSVSREDVTKIQHPLLVFMGKDRSHPSETSRDIVSLAPEATLVERWRDGDDDPKVVEALIQQFLIDHGGVTSK